MVNTVRLSVVALATLINVAFMAASENLLSLDTAVWPANDTDLMPEEDFDYGSAITERKKCPASKKCTDAGGSCIKSRAYCDGTVNPQGCKGKKCKCCIPYQTTCPSCPTVPDCPTISTSTCAPCTTQPITTTAEICPSPFRLRGNECFFVHEDQNEALNWDESRQRCLSMGGDLAQPQNMVDFVNYIKEDYSNSKSTIWLGATDKDVEGQWKWLSGESVPPAMWEPWPHNQPSGDGNCMEIHYWSNTDFYMNDWYCHMKGHYACEIVLM